MDVHDHEVEGAVACRGQRLEAVGDHLRRVPGHREVGGEDLPVGRVVLGDQHAQGRELDRLDRRRRIGIGRVRGRRGRDPEAEGAAEAGDALDRDLAAHQLDELAGDREAEPGAAALARHRRLDLGEALEQEALRLLRDADAGIADRDLEPAAGARQVAERDVDGAGLGELDRVADQVHQHLPQPRRVAEQGPRHLRADGRRHVDVAVGGAGRHQCDDVAGEGVHVGGRGRERDPVRLELGQVEDVVDDGEQVLGAVAGDGRALALARVVLAAQDEVEHAEHPVHRRAESRGSSSRGTATSRATRPRPRAAWRRAPGCAGRRRSRPSSRRRCASCRRPRGRRRRSPGCGARRRAAPAGSPRRSGR